MPKLLPRWLDRHAVMQPMNVLSLAPEARAWLANSRHPRILHVFDRACNLINEHGEVLSIVTLKIGNGPFSLVIDQDVGFSAYLDLEARISTSASQLSLGSLTININEAEIWNPSPNWEELYANRDNIVKQLTKLQITDYPVHGLNIPFVVNAQGYPPTHSLQSLVSSFCSALASADLSTVKKVTSRFAGFGVGLTPAGDDFIMGAIHAAWIIHPPEVARGWVQEIAGIAAPLTTSLSAAWLRSAGRGEAGVLWHEFFAALICGDPVQIEASTGNILAVGETSGADALAGFFGTIMASGKFAQPESD